MKEMVGGCCVCSDERGWAENPLVYCDGHGCNVAVHQACYGIVQVPTGPWFCRKCESQERAARVTLFQRCELCPQKEGALKRTDTGGWCHVVCALFIPEAWFANVQTMEPIVLKNVPQERFNKVCYICEEQSRESKAATGACMQCNKNGCKQNFHVTCAQAQGLLCEEAGNYGDNVKYCGYCMYHYKKLTTLSYFQKKDANIKTIPAFKPISCETSTPETTPEKNFPSRLEREKAKLRDMKADSSYFHPSNLSNHPSSLTSSDRERLLPNIAHDRSRPPKLLSTPPQGPNQTQSESSLTTPGEFDGFNEAESKNHSVPPTTTSYDSCRSDSSVTSQHSSDLASKGPGSTLTASENKLIMDARFTVLPEASRLLTSPSNGSFTTTVTTVQNSMVSSQPQTTFSSNYDSYLSGNHVSASTTGLNGVTTVVNSSLEQTQGKRQRSRSAEKQDKKNKKNKCQQSSNNNKSKSNKDILATTSPSSSSDMSPSDSKKTLAQKKSDAPITSGPLGNPNYNVFGGSPYFQSLSASGPVSISGFSQTNLENNGILATSVVTGSHLTSNLETSTSPNLTPPPLANEGTSPLSVGCLLGPPKIFPSINSEKLLNENVGNGLVQSMEQLLEHQWDLGSQFLMEQGQHFDIASLLSFLHQLKTENRRLEDCIKSLTARRDHLLALNARLALPLSALNTSQLLAKATGSPCALLQQPYQNPGCTETNLTQDSVSNSHTPSHHSPAQQQSSTPGRTHISSPNGSYQGSSHSLQQSGCSPIQTSLSRSSSVLVGSTLDSSRLQHDLASTPDQHSLVVYPVLQQSQASLSQGPIQSSKSTNSPSNLIPPTSSAPFNSTEAQISNKTSHDTKIKEKS
ncbi:protein AF-10 isoform X2 [Octopus bimaculoides]|uniref:protein AF-10 isoform X2 n=1 Tax=Octopus bimaculoides TaxID=37653 RepID=UPI00071CD252|nr:protein AF-10 isoform X2 [Octopus bimaculoides]|eukprot:XP_014782469.1 PREDICTED: protein AF-10-like isoform X2 [Octopus bimaculoides]